MAMNFQVPASRWRTAGVYLLWMAGFNTIWEIAQFPLYQIWLEGSFRAQIYAIIHCTIGDVMIAAVSLTLAYVLVGRGPCSHRRFWATALATTAFGLAYTVFSEWQNVSIRGSWAYRDIMPLVPPFGTGLAPLLQWTILPLPAFALVHRISRP
ncbi:MAG: hypothetical protein VR74_15460 [Hyphomonas sp. BRH_c22]|nr:MAG: hypothetical protein VR74_15460 [Hyphomonas sp. BRH_c22]